ncbi:MAG: hybrid sensor histidine kinase/response regulator [Thermodesulfobacteriota bacterium]
MLENLLKKYDRADLILQQKARVLLIVGLLLLIILPIIIGYTVLFTETTAPGVLLPTAITIVVIAGALCLLVKGHFTICGHLILITGFIATWSVILFDQSPPLIRLDTIAFVFAVLSLTPLATTAGRAIIFYFALNSLILTGFMVFWGPRMGLTHVDFIDYWADNLTAMGIMGLASCSIFLINHRALKKAETDIQERRKAEEETAATKAFLQSSLASIPSGILLFDDKVQFNYINPVFLDWIGKTEAAFLGKTLVDVAADYLHPESAARIAGNIIARIQKGERILNAEIALIDKDGNEKPVSFSAAGIIDKQGLMIGGVAILVDLTLQKQMEMKLRQSQRMEAIGTMAGGIAHDFNNILSAIMGNAELLSLDSVAAKEDKQKLDNIVAACQRAKELIRHILLVSREIRAEHQPVCLQSVIAETMELLKGGFPGAIQLRQELTAAPLWIMADPVHMHQIVMNICTNARQSMSRNRGVVEVRLEKLDIRPGEIPPFPELAAGEWAAIHISDTGDGMPPEVLERIFVPYYSTKQKGLGTGLGLSVVHGIIQSYSGLITVQSKPGEGTRFSIFLPLTKAPGETRKPAAMPLVLGENQRILFVDDEEMLAELGKAMLTRLGYRAVTATSPDRALEIFRSEPEQFQLVITDMTMPQMSGADLAQQLLQVRPDIPILLCTGYSEVITRESALEMGIRDFLLKPIRVEDFAAKIRDALRCNPSN